MAIALKDEVLIQEAKPELKADGIGFTGLRLYIEKSTGVMLAEITPCKHGGGQWAANDDPSISISNLVEELKDSAEGLQAVRSVEAGLMTIFKAILVKRDFPIKV